MDPEPLGGAWSVQGPAHPLLVDWLETGPVHSGEIRRALVAGGPSDVERVAAWAPGAQVANASTADVGPFDLVASIDPPGHEAPDLARLSAGVRRGGLLLVIATVHTSSGRTRLESNPPGAEFALLAFDELGGTSGGQLRRWTRATYRRFGGGHLP